MVTRTLIIFRHGKAEAHNPFHDKTRVLTSKGIADASKMGMLISEKFKSVDLVVASDADRASQTARIASEAFHYTGSVDFKPEIYEATVDTLLSIIHSLPENAYTVVLVGHNPGLEELCSDLSGRQITLPTCGLAGISVKGNWIEAEFGEGEITGLWNP